VEAVAARDPVPALIRRNTALLAATQVFVGSGIQFTAGLGPLVVVSLLGSPLLAGLAVATTGIGRIIGGYTFGRFSDRRGRRPSIVLGMGIALVGTLCVGSSVQAGWFPGFAFGMIAFAVGMQGVQQMRLAAAEMYPPERRSLILGLMLTVAVGGVIVGPTLVGFSEAVSVATGLERLATPWLLIPVMIIPSMLAVRQVRPDPRRIALNLTAYFPSHRAPAPVQQESGRFGIAEFFADPRRRGAALAMFSAQAAMQMAMVMLPLQLDHHGQTLTAITLSNSIHVAGMFGLSMPIGWLADRVGGRAVLVAGVLIEAAGAAVASGSAEYAVVTFGVFLVGVGWSCANVSSSALVIEHTPPAFRGRAVGTMDSLTSLGVFFPMLVGPIVQWWGVPAAGIAAFALVALPLPYVLHLRGRQPAAA